VSGVCVQRGGVLRLVISLKRRAARAFVVLDPLGRILRVVDFIDEGRCHNWAILVLVALAVAAPLADEPCALGSAAGPVLVSHCSAPVWRGRRRPFAVLRCDRQSRRLPCCRSQTRCPAASEAGARSTYCVR